MRSRLLISSMILAVGLTAATAGPAPIYVDNIRGNDTYDGSRERPFASLEKACRQVRTSGRIEVVNTGKPYQMPYDGPGRHGLRLRTGGTPDAPLVVEGNGAEISCLAVIPATAWTREEERIYSLPFDPMSNMFRRDRTKDYWLVCRRPSRAQSPRPENSEKNTRRLLVEQKGTEGSLSSSGRANTRRAEN